MKAWRLLAIAALCALAGCAAPPSGGGERETRAAADPPDPARIANARLELAGLYFGRGQSATALDEIKRALAAKPEMAEAFSLRGLVYASMGDAAQADESFQRALQLAPRDGGTMHNYAWFLCQQRRYAQAESHFTNALAQPGYGDAVRTLLAQGVCQAREGRLADAERTLSRSYELDPASPVTAYNLADVLLRMGELERARFYVARINADRDLSSAQSLWLATRIERRLGNLPLAEQLGRQLRERFPQSTEALQFERGRFDE
ncbi:MAG: type IV pilus biogenesis/stability protein PilW [Rubrivivax sp.]|nr:type IV pilus biogenesis/stability protein PilW [Rubrivivax sp.]